MTTKNWFQRSMLVGGLAAAMVFSGCQSPNASATTRASGSLALTQDDSAVLAVDTDNGVMVEINTGTREISRTVQLGAGSKPSHVVVGPDDTAFVTTQGDRSVAVIRKGDDTPATRIPVGVEPSGMTLTPDGKTLLVVSATALDKTNEGLLTAIDVNSLQKKWELEVGEEPRGVVVVAGNRALVSHYKEGDYAEVNLADGSIIKKGTNAIYAAANATQIAGNSNTFGGTISTYHPRGVSNLIVTGDGNRVFAPVTWSREDSITIAPNSSGGYYAAGGPCNIGSVASAGIVTIDTAGAPTPQVDDLTACAVSGVNSGDKDFPVSTLGSNDPTVSPVQGATAGVVDPAGDWVIVLSRETRNVAFMPTWKRTGTGINFDSTGSSVRTVVDLEGHGADGLAISKDGTRAYVYSQFDHQLEVLGGQGKGEQSRISHLATVKVPNQFVALDAQGNDVTAEFEAGRKLFFDARDRRVSSAQTNVACASCHLEGREDGHVWQFPDGPRQTPMLGGRKLLSTAPYHWSGEFETLGQFNSHTIIERMGGSGLDERAAGKLDLFVDALPLADNPLRTSMPSDAVARGRASFEKAQCATCHTGALFTNNLNENVQTAVFGDRDDVKQKGFNVPSLLGVGRTAPYLHDGSQLTIEQRVNANPNDAHGTTSALSQTEKADLVAYLKSL